MSTDFRASGQDALHLEISAHVVGREHVAQGKSARPWVSRRGDLRSPRSGRQKRRACGDGRGFCRPLPGLTISTPMSQGCADLPWATGSRPLRGLLARKRDAHRLGKSTFYYGWSRRPASSSRLPIPVDFLSSDRCASSGDSGQPVCVLLALSFNHKLALRHSIVEMRNRLRQRQEAMVTLRFGEQQTRSLPRSRAFSRQ